MERMLVNCIAVKKYVDDTLKLMFIIELAELKSNCVEISWQLYHLKAIGTFHFLV